LKLESEKWDAAQMPWTKPRNGSAHVTSAGKVISGRKQPSDGLDIDTALSIAGNWRSSHGYPLHVFNKMLRGRAKEVDSHALVAQRLKRLPSIITKLQRFHAMQLSTMQDLGGCRAVVRSVSTVDRLVKRYEGNPTRVARFIGKKDYILNPKPDGYRGVHLIYEYQGESQGGAFCGLKIEVQIRSRLQHAWATALETIDTFTDQALKSGFGNDLWKRFFALMATAIALREKRPTVPETPTSRQELSQELKPLCKELKVPDVFLGLSLGLQTTTEKKVTEVLAYILVLDTEEKTVRTIPYASNEQAAEDYIMLEKEHLEKPNIRTVLVSVDSVAALKTAYPSFYLDAHRFAALVNQLIDSDE
jgi:ppGpp synthetase/RelA/SpoT-type nucleotidyltranferase